jgi:PAS domain S-box-containing protein
MLAEFLKKGSTAESIFHKMLNSIPIAMLLVDTKGKIVYSNRHSEELFGYSQSSFLGKQIEELIPERYRKNHPSNREKYIQLPKVKSIGIERDLFGLRIDGSEVNVEIGLIPVRIQEGLFVLATVVDITERVIIQQQLNIEEETKRNLQIVNDQLSEFAHIVSHDLSDPFMKLERLLPHLIDSLKEPTKEITEITNKMDDYLQRGKKLIADLLAFAQSNSIKVSEINLSETVEEIISIYADSGINISVHDIPNIKADSVLIRQIFSNLISNAVKFQKEVKDKKIIIGYENNTFFIRDNGIGIPEEDMNKIFKPLFRIHSNEDKYYGSGLGLSIVKKAIQKHNGKIWIESKLNEGTTVFFKLWT